MTRIAVTELEYRKAEPVFSAAAGEGMECLSAPIPEAELAAFIRREQAEHAILGVDRYARELYEALPRGGVIARFGVGHDGVDKVLATGHGLLCTNTPGVLDQSVAECAVGLIVTAARHYADCIADNRRGRWNNRVGSELAGKTLAIIGCGAIGRKVAAIAAHGYGMNVIGFDVAPVDAAELKATYGISRMAESFAAAVAGADFVSLHIPDIPATRDFIDAETLALFPSKAVLVNTARGAVVDETALYEAVAGGGLAGAALDVVKSEPYVPDPPDRDLRTLEPVIMTPHLGSSTVEACTRMAEAALHNIRLAVEGRHGEMALLNPECL